MLATFGLTYETRYVARFFAQSDDEAAAKTVASAMTMFMVIAALATLGALLGIVSNVVRVNAIVLIDWMRGSQMELTAHGTIQWIALFATLGLLFYVLSRLKGDAEPETPTIDATEQDRPIRRVGPVL